MSVRIVGLSVAAAAAVAAMALSACGSAAPAASPPRSPASSPAPSPSASSSASAAGHAPPPPLGAPIIIAVHLGTTFTPDTLTLAAGMKFQVIVSPTVTPSGLSFPAHCTPGAAYAVNDGMLLVTCQSGGGYLFTAERAGPTVVSATVRPRCSPGQMCPQWITDAALRLTIT